MRLTVFTLIISLLTVSEAVAQVNKPQDQEPAAPTIPTTEKPKNAVDQMLEDAAKRGETILAACVADCDSELIDDGVEKGKALQLAKPAYPNIARMAHADGEVQVQVIIGEEGKVVAAAAISGHPLLFGVSVEAARNSKFTPTLLHGKPVKVIGVIKYNFIAP